MLLSLCSHVPVFCYYPGSDPSVNFAAFSSVFITESREQDYAPLPSSPGGSEETCTCLPAVPCGSALMTPLYLSACWSFSSALSGETKTQTRVHVCLRFVTERGKEKYRTVGNTSATKCHFGVHEHQRNLWLLRGCSFISYALLKYRGYLRCFS